MIDNLLWLGILSGVESRENHFLLVECITLLALMAGSLELILFTKEPAEIRITKLCTNSTLTEIKELSRRILQ